MDTFTELLLDAVEPDMELRHRIVSGIIRVIVGGLAGAFAVKVYKDRVIESEEAVAEDLQHVSL